MPLNQPKEYEPAPPPDFVAASAAARSNVADLLDRIQATSSLLVGEAPSTAISDGVNQATCGLFDRVRDDSYAICAMVKAMHDELNRIAAHLPAPAGQEGRLRSS